MPDLAEVAAPEPDERLAGLSHVRHREDMSDKHDMICRRNPRGYLALEGGQPASGDQGAGRFATLMRHVTE